MKFNYNLKKAITMILTVIITISTVCTVGYTPVYATVKNSNVLEDVMIELQDKK